MSKLYDALKRLEQSKRPPSAHNLNKKPNKKNIKWVLLFFGSILIGSLLIHISNLIGPNPTTHTQENAHSIKISTLNKTNATNSTTAISNATIPTNSTQVIKTKPKIASLKPSPQITQTKALVQSHVIANNSSNKDINKPSLSNSTKQEQLKNILIYQQEKAEKLANLALSINHSIESGDYYRAKLLLKQYLSIQEDPFALNDLAAIYIKEGKYAQAAKLLQKSITQQQSAAAYINLIYCYKKLNEIDRLDDILKTVNPAIFSEEQKAIIYNIIHSK
jgi:tetratricopeptide (TPR) repeat protein